MLKTIFTDTLESISILQAVSGTSAINGTGVDMAGYDGVAFVAQCGLSGSAGGFVLKAQQDTDVAFGTAADLLGTAQTVTTGSAAKASGVLDVYKPKERYVRPVVTPDANANGAPLAVLAIRYGGRALPETNTGELHVSPAEGTA